MSIVPINFEGIKLEAQAHSKFEFIMSSREVAEGYGVKTRAIRDHKHLHADELIENKHFFTCVEKIDAGKPPVKYTMWTKRGIIRLGFFIKSERAKKFRDFIEDLVVRIDEQIVERSGGSEDILSTFEHKLNADLLLAQNAQIAELIKKLEGSYEAIITAKDETIHAKEQAISAQDTAIESQRLALGIANNYVRDKSIAPRPTKKRKYHRVVSKSEHFKMIDMRLGGISVYKIAEATGWSEWTVRRHTQGKSKEYFCERLR